MGDNPNNKRTRDSIMQKISAGIAIFFAALGAVFMIVGMAGWTEECGDVKRTAWAEMEAPGGVGTSYLGLRGRASSFNSQCVYMAYRNMGGVDLAEDCKDAGEIAVLGTIIAFFCFCANIVFTVLRCCKGGACMKYSNIIFSVLAMLFAVAAVANHVNNCSQANGLDYDLSVGAISTILGLICGVVIIIVHACVPATVVQQA